MGCRRSKAWIKTIIGIWVVVVVSASCKTGQKQRTVNGAEICCYTVICSTSQKFEFCNKDQGSDDCYDCPADQYTNDKINTSLWDIVIDPCVPRPECKADEVILVGNECRCNLGNGYYGDPSNCLLDAGNCRHAGYQLNNEGRCSPCDNDKFKPEKDSYGICRDKTRCSNEEREEDPGWIDRDRKCVKTKVQTTSTLEVTTPDVIDPTTEKDQSSSSDLNWIVPLVFLCVLVVALSWGCYKRRDSIKGFYHQHNCCKIQSNHDETGPEGERMLENVTIEMIQNERNHHTGPCNGSLHVPNGNVSMPTKTTGHNDSHAARDTHSNGHVSRENGKNFEEERTAAISLHTDPNVINGSNINGHVIRGNDHQKETIFNVSDQNSGEAAKGLNSNRHLVREKGKINEKDSKLNGFDEMDAKFGSRLQTGDCSVNTETTTLPLVSDTEDEDDNFVSFGDSIYCETGDPSIGDISEPVIETPSSAHSRSVHSNQTTPVHSTQKTNQSEFVTAKSKQSNAISPGIVSNSEVNLPNSEVFRTAEIGNIPQSELFNNLQTEREMLGEASNGNVSQSDLFNSLKTNEERSNQGYHGNIPQSNLFHSLQTDIGRCDQSSSGNVPQSDLFHSLQTADQDSSNGNTRPDSTDKCQTETGHSTAEVSPVTKPLGTKKQTNNLKICPVKPIVRSESQNGASGTVIHHDNNREMSNEFPASPVTAYGRDIQTATNNESYKTVANAPYPAERLRVNIPGESVAEEDLDGSSSQQDGSESQQTSISDYAELGHSASETQSSFGQSLASDRLTDMTTSASGNPIRAPESDNSGGSMEPELGQDNSQQASQDVSGSLNENQGAHNFY